MTYIDLNLGSPTLGIAGPIVRFGPSGRITVKRIQQVVADYYEVPVECMWERYGAPHTIEARHVAIYLSRQQTKMSFPEIGRRFGGLDHTSVMHAVRRIVRRMSKGGDLAADVGAIREALDARTAPRVLEAA